MKYTKERDLETDARLIGFALTVLDALNEVRDLLIDPRDIAERTRSNQVLRTFKLIDNAISKGERRL